MGAFITEPDKKVRRNTLVEKTLICNNYFVYIKTLEIIAIYGIFIYNQTVDEWREMNGKTSQKRAG